MPAGSIRSEDSSSPILHKGLCALDNKWPAQFRQKHALIPRCHVCSAQKSFGKMRKLEFKWKHCNSSENAATPSPMCLRELAQLMLQVNFCTLKHLRTCPILGLQGAKVHKGPYETSKTHKLHSCMLSFYAHRFKCSVLRLLQIYLLLQKASIQVWDIHKKATYKKKKLCTDA